MLTKLALSGLRHRRPITLAATEDKIRLQSERRFVDTKAHFLLDGIALTIRKIG